MPPCQDQAGHRHLQVTECQTDRTIGLPVDSDSMSVLEGGLCGEGGGGQVVAVCQTKPSDKMKMKQIAG